MIKRYLCFCFDHDQPRGAEGDYHGDFDSVPSAMGDVFDIKADAVDIFDIATGRWASWYLSSDGNVYIPASLSYELH